ncbi:MAG: right-handed parallel beta-helix repeat-containing protein [Planctomycetota bacterium]|jgi:parallel beta-helix repeat protein
MKIAILLAVILYIPALAISATIYVPDHYPTIQQAIDAAVNGDTVIVKPGTFVENIDFIGKAITVMSEEGPANTVIDANGYGRVVAFQNYEGPDSILEGFTLRNGYMMSGSGIYCYNASPTIMHNNVTENVPGQGGGSIACRNGSPVIKFNSIHDNGIWYQEYGDGIICDEASPIITDNDIRSNLGFGIACFDSTPHIENNDLFGNGGYQMLSGGIMCGGSSPTIMNNRIEFNGSTYAGAGIFCFYGSSPSIVNNLVCNNTGEAGGGIFCEDDCDPIITNNTIVGNTAEYSLGGGIFCQNNCHPIVTNTIIWQNYPGQVHGDPLITYSDVQGGWQGVGNIDSDPLLVHLIGDMHLTFNSPCRASGDNTAPDLPVTDFEGDPRIAYSTVDMGADEFYTHLYCMGDFTPGGSIEGKLVGLPGTSPVGVFLGSGVLDPAVPTAWGNFHLQAPWFLIPLVPIPGDGVLKLPATIPSTPPAPYDLPMQALIGLNPDSLTNLFVMKVE